MNPFEPDIPEGMAPNLASALALFQAELPVIKRNVTVDVETKSGPGYQFSYTDLSTLSRIVLPLAAKLGLSWACLPTMVDGKMAMHYQLMYGPTNEKMEGDYPIGASGLGGVAGAFTTARRLALSAVFGVASEQDDEAAKAEQAMEGMTAAERRAATKVTAAPRTAKRAAPREEGPGGTEVGYTREQQSAMFALLGELGITGREAGLAKMNEVLQGFDPTLPVIESSKELTGVTMRVVLAGLDHERALRTDGAES